MPGTTGLRRIANVHMVLDADRVAHRAGEIETLRKAVQSAFWQPGCGMVANASREKNIEASSLTTQCVLLRGRDS